MFGDDIKFNSKKPSFFNRTKGTEPPKTAPPAEKRQPEESKTNNSGSR
jgi:hypothetical protein